MVKVYLVFAIRVCSLTNALKSVFFSNNTFKYTQQKQKIDSLNSVIIKLEDKQIELNRSIFDQQLEINILNHSIDSTNKEIVKVRKYYAKKIKDITTYTPTQLDNFFTERYQ